MRRALLFAVWLASSSCATVPELGNSDAAQCIELTCAVPIIIFVGIPCAIAYTAGWCTGYEDGRREPEEPAAAPSAEAAASSEGALAHSSTSDDEATHAY